MVVTRRTVIRNVSAGLMTSIPAFAKSLLVLSTSRTIDIRNHGAVGDGKTVNTRAIQAAIDACAAAGGGMIAVPAGIFVSGSIVLRPGVGLELRQYAVLRGSTNLADYPIVMRRLVEPYPEPLHMALVNSRGNDRFTSSDRERSTGMAKRSGAFFPNHRRRASMESRSSIISLSFAFSRIASRPSSVA